jgi:hypothetical protein
MSRPQAQGPAVGERDVCKEHAAAHLRLCVVDAQDSFKGECVGYQHRCA